MDLFDTLPFYDLSDPNSLPSCSSSEYVYTTPLDPIAEKVARIRSLAERLLIEHEGMNAFVAVRIARDLDSEIEHVEKGLRADAAKESK